MSYREPPISQSHAHRAVKLRLRESEVSTPESGAEREDMDTETESQTKHKETRFLKAYDKHLTSLFRYIYYRTGQEKSEAEELTQEVFMRTWAYLQKDARPIEDIRAFLFQVARHVIADRWRKHKPTLALEQVNPDEEPRSTPQSDMIVDIIILEQHLLTLPDKHREALTLRFINDMTTEETGKIMGMTANHVAVLTNRALNKLRKLMPEITS